MPEIARQRRNGPAVFLKGAERGRREREGACPMHVYAMLELRQHHGRMRRLFRAYPKTS